MVEEEIGGRDVGLLGSCVECTASCAAEEFWYLLDRGWIVGFWELLRGYVSNILKREGF